MSAEKLLKKFNYKNGDTVSVRTKNEVFEGIIMPSHLDSTITIKLKNGYNIAIDKKSIENIKNLQKPERIGKPQAQMPQKNPKLQTISILLTGGTISSTVDYTTGVVKVAFGPNDLLSMFPELSAIANFKTKLIGQMYSEDIRFAHYQIMAKEIEKEINESGIKGIILAHGTDTMCYTAAALAFMLENPPVPIVLVGSMRSTDRGSTDAALNLVCATEFIAKTDYCGVCICTHETSSDESCVILPATKTRKLHTSRRDAFRAVNDTPIARIDYSTRQISFIKKEYQKHDDKKKFALKKEIEQKVAIIKCHPNMFPEQFDFFRKQKFRGLVLEGTGLGQAPVGVPNKEAKLNEKIFESIKKLIKSGCVVAMTSQCIFGATQKHVYNDALKLNKEGVVFARDTLSETAFIKLAWLLGNYTKEKAQKHMEQNIRGEINEKIAMSTFNPKNFFD